jgi:flagellar export protein FliJ
MKRFVFRLERVLGIRRFELERARMALSVVEAEAVRLAALLAEAERRLAEGRRLLEEETVQGADGPRLALRARAVRSGRTQWLFARQNVESFEPRRAKAREEVRRCRARVESLERLRERRADLHRQAALAADQAELEGLAMARFARASTLLVLLCALLLGAVPVADAKEAAPAAKPAAKAEVPDGQKSSAGASEAKAGAPKSDAKTPEGAGGGLTALLSGPGFSKGVDAILVEVQSREVELARRELELAEREVAVQELESMVAERAGELEKIRAEVENRILAWTSYGQDRIAQLSGVYSAMPPADAAQLLGKLDLDLAVSVIRQMKKKVSASILAAMNPDRALLVSRRILQPLDPSTDAPPARPY